MWNRCKVDKPHLLIHLRKELQELGKIEGHRLTSQNLRLTASKSSELEETGSKLRKIGKLKSMVLPQPGTSVNHISWQRSQRPDLGALRSGSTSGETWDGFSSGSAKARCQVPNCFNRNHRHGASAICPAATRTGGLTGQLSQNMTVFVFCQGFQGVCPEGTRT